MTFKQRENESFKDFMTRLNKKLTIDDQDGRIVLDALLRGIWPQSSFMVELARKTLSSL